MRRRKTRREHDIKAPDGYLLGGLRKVRPDGTVLFKRSWWKCPEDWIGEEVWLHTNEPTDFYTIDAAEPGVHIYTARCDHTQVELKSIDRPDAKPGYRDRDHKAWAAKNGASQ